MLGPGLALEQAPPFATPLRFFLTAPWFLAAAGLLAAWAPAWSDAPLTPAGLALTHLVTLGFLGMVMLGALTQMLPVVAGAPVPAVKAVAALAHAGLVLGTPLLSWGLATASVAALDTAGIALALGLTGFLTAASFSLAKARSIDTMRAMALALAFLAATALIGLALTGWLAGHWPLADPLAWLGRHALLGMAGWVGMLVVGTAWQVVPMLQLTPAYPPRLTRALLVALAVSLPAALLLPPPWQVLGQGGLALGFIAFALATLDLQRRRKRKIADVTLQFWRLGMICLILAAVLFPLPLPEAGRTTIGILFLAGFAVPVVNGMLYKIVPFLAWFHLQSQKGILAAGLPSMKDYLPDQRARGQFLVYLAAVACLLAAPFLPALALPGGLLLALSSAWLGLNLIQAVRLYRAHGGLL
jgi:hypothetical protein